MSRAEVMRKALGPVLGPRVKGGMPGAQAPRQAAGPGLGPQLAPFRPGRIAPLCLPRLIGAWVPALG